MELTNCPFCGSRLVKAKNFIEGETVHACKPCGRFKLEGVERWIDGGPGLRDTMRRLAMKRDEDKARDELARTSPIEDPMWTRIP